MPKIKDIDFEPVELIRIDDKLFLDQEECDKYIESCQATYTTNNFFSKGTEIVRTVGREEMLEIYEGDEDALDDACHEYTDYVDELCFEYEIEYTLKRSSLIGPVYELTGPFGNLKKFAAEYSPYLDMGVVGEALSDVAEVADIDLDSGDVDYILGEYSC